MNTKTHYFERSSNRAKQRVRRYSQNRRLGVAAVEFAVVAPIMILLMFGLVELGRILMIKNALTHASREGARLAVTPAATSSSVQQLVQENLTSYFSGQPEVTITPSNLAAASPGATVKVNVAVDIALISWIPGAITLPISKLSAETVMRRESTN